MVLEFWNQDDFWITYMINYFACKFIHEEECHKKTEDAEFHSWLFSIEPLSEPRYFVETNKNHLCYWWIQFQF